MKTLITLLAALLVVSCVFSMPTDHERWRSPCGYDMLNYSLHVTTNNERPLVEIIDEMLIQILESQNYATKLRNIYAVERIESSSLLSLLELAPLKGFPAVKELSEGDLNNAVQNISGVHLEYYRQLSIHLVFIEQMRFDEEIYENKQYMEEMYNLERKLFDVLCIMTEAISNDDVNIEHMSRDVMAMDIRALSERFDRFTRDYVTVKETSKLIGNLAIMYTTIKDHARAL